MSVKFILTRDINGYNGFGLPFTPENYSSALTQDTADSFTVPENFPDWIAVFSYSQGNNVWVSVNDTAGVPAGNLTANTSQLNPSARQVKAGDVVSVITGDTSAYVGISLYAIP